MPVNCTDLGDRGDELMKKIHEIDDGAGALCGPKDDGRYYVATTDDTVGRRAASAVHGIEFVGHDGGCSYFRSVDDVAANYTDVVADVLHIDAIAEAIGEHSTNYVGCLVEPVESDGDVGLYVSSENDKAAIDDAVTAIDGVRRAYRKGDNFMSWHVDIPFDEYLRENVFTAGVYCIKDGDIGRADVKVAEFDDGTGHVISADLQRAIDDDGVDVYAVSGGWLLLNDER